MYLSFILIYTANHRGWFTSEAVTAVQWHTADQQALDLLIKHRIYHGPIILKKGLSVSVAVWEVRDILNQKTFEQILWLPKQFESSACLKFDGGILGFLKVPPFR